MFVFGLVLLFVKISFIWYTGFAKLRLNKQSAETMLISWMIKTIDKLQCYILKLV